MATFYTNHALESVGKYVREDLHYVMDRELLFRVCKKYKLITDMRPYGAFRRHSQSKSITSGIQFGDEFAKLYSKSQSANMGERNFKNKIARFYRAKGYLHYAKYNNLLLKSNQAFLNAIRIYPEFVLTKNFWISLLKKNFINQTLIEE